MVDYLNNDLSPTGAPAWAERCHISDNPGPAQIGLDWTTLTFYF